MDELLNTFSEIEKTMEREDGIKEKISQRVKRVDQEIRKISMTLQEMHFLTTQKNEWKQIPQKINFDPITELLFEIDQVLPPFSYFKYHFLFTGMWRRISLSMCITQWLHSGKMLTKKQCDEKLKFERLKNLEFPVSEFLIGMCKMFGELSRLTVNCVTRQDYETPLQISSFLHEIYKGLKMLNLKNDQLRRTFDSTKYELKKIEEVVYDLSIRKLINK